MLRESVCSSSIEPYLSYRRITYSTMHAEFMYACTHVSHRTADTPCRMWGTSAHVGGQAGVLISISARELSSG
jgi:hypothetical protein